VPITAKRLILRRVGRFSVGQDRVDLRAQRRDLLLKLRLLLDHPLVAHRLVARSVRAQLGAIDGQHPQPAAQPRRAICS
jgi:hypothetical protein